MNLQSSSPLSPTRVVCAVLHQGNRLLITQRKRGAHLENYWEFPGGKVLTGETLENALTREIEEELNITVQIKSLLREIHYQYEDKPEPLHLFFFLCEI